MQAKIVMKPVTVIRDTIFDPTMLYVTANDSTGRLISVDDIRRDGNVDTRRPGRYPVQYSFTDEASGQDIIAHSLVTVTA